MKTPQYGQNAFDLKRTVEATAQQEGHNVFIKVSSLQRIEVKEEVL